MIEPADEEADRPHPDLAKREILTMLRKIGVFQLGRPVDLDWALSAAERLATRKLGITDFDLTQCSDADTILRVHAGVSRLLYEAISREEQQCKQSGHSRPPSA